MRANSTISRARAAAQFVFFGVLLSATTPAAFAGGMTEAQLMGIYERCLTEHVEPFHHATMPRHAPYREEYDATIGKWNAGADYEETAEYHNPLIGSAQLNVHIYDGAFDNLDYSSDYHDGELKIETQLLECDAPGNCQSDRILGARPLHLPYFSYQTVKNARTTTNNLGYFSNTEQTLLAQKPRLMVYPGPDRLPFLNDDTGQPIRSPDGKPALFDVKSYARCLKSRVDRAYAPPASKEVAGAEGSVGNGVAPKNVPASASATEAAPGACSAVTAH